MFNFIASIIFAANVNASAPKTAQICEWVGPRVDGISVLICDGSVKAMRDATGNTVAYPEAR